MPLLLVPYNVAMRFGVGYNSYTQTMCIDNAVDATEENTATSENSPQKVSYSVKAIEQVSDMVDELDISRAATIQSGTIEAHGISNAFEDADISLMISMKVINQTASLKASVPFKPIGGLLPGSRGFTKAFGDSYISGFVRGGHLATIFPFSCSNLGNKEDLIQRVKQVSFSRMADLDKVAEDLVNISLDGVKNAVPIILTLTGGVIKGEIDTCDTRPVLTEAVDLPSYVAANPQRTWKAQRIISHQDQYVNTLLAVRGALEREMDKIAAVVNALARQPELLLKKDYSDSNSKNELVQSIIDEALSPNVSERESPTRDHGSLRHVAEYSPSEASGSFEDIYTPQSSDMDSASLRGMPTLFLNRSDPFDDLKLHLLIPPGVRAELLLERTEATASVIENGINTETAIKKRVKEFQKLQIMAAADASYPVDHDKRLAELFEITQKSQHQRVKGVSFSMHGLKLFRVMYGGKIYHAPSDLERFMENVDHNNSGLWPCIQFNKETVGDDHSGRDDITGVVFYEYTNSPGIQSAVSLGGTGCLLKNQRQLVDLAQEAIKEDTNRANKKGNNELKPYTVDLHKDIAAGGESSRIPTLALTITPTSGYCCTFKGGTLKVKPSESPFLQFENGVEFFFRNSGVFEVLGKNDEVLWSSDGVPEGQSPGLLEFSSESKLHFWNAIGQVYWSPSMPWFDCPGRMVLSSQWPYLEIYDGLGKQLWCE
ncbi:hypothetical protein FACUT_13685 [Fusarium acutatum]|uniref:Bulb-type lectin domain-containing protein n=1 Tax=Fusarium acutatum TaxID=78861 RepID=A0A8H4NHR1_9HYPO|nr:hypothetical protein FACUT_13685 [Fusarium acutatum]